ncbi:MAG: hypothetical protein HZB35_01210 [Nitrospirae bacterium]|nr:hypothetical protein [Nitrospirota bacterium]
MTFRKADWIFAGAALMVIIGVAMLPSPRDRNPIIPTDPEHQAVTVEKTCLNCHAPMERRPLPDRHPTRQDCFRCHARSGG